MSNFTITSKVILFLSNCDKINSKIILLFVAGMDIGIGLGEEPGPSGGRDQKSEEEYHFEVLSTDQIVQHMVESIKEVNSVIQVSRT